MDSQNRPHIAYGKNNLYHAWYDGAQWLVETVDSEAGVGSGASIFIDPSDKIHIAYADHSKPDSDSSPANS